MIAIIGAMEEEIARLKEEMTGTSETNKAGMTFCAGTLCGRDVVVVCSGIGKVNAAICTQILADEFGAEAIINTGIAGGLRDGIGIGDVVVSTDAVQYDVHAEVFGYAAGQIPRMDVLAFPADEALVALAEEVCAEVNPDIRAHRGRVASGDSFISERAEAGMIRDTFDAYCTEMEGAAIAQAAYLNHIPCVILRAISDNADESAAEDSETFDQKAIRHSLALVRGMLERM